MRKDSEIDELLAKRQFVCDICVMTDMIDRESYFTWIMHCAIRDVATTLDTLGTCKVFSIKYQQIFPEYFFTIYGTSILVNMEQVYEESFESLKVSRTFFIRLFSGFL